MSWIHVWCVVGGRRNAIANITRRLSHHWVSLSFRLSSRGSSAARRLVNAICYLNDNDDDLHPAFSIDRASTNSLPLINVINATFRPAVIRNAVQYMEMLKISLKEPFQEWATTVETMTKSQIPQLIPYLFRRMFDNPVFRSTFQSSLFPQTFLWAVLLLSHSFFFLIRSRHCKNDKKSDDVDEVKIKYHQRQSSVSLLSSYSYSCCCYSVYGKVKQEFFLSSFHSMMLLCSEWRDELKLIENVQERVTNF